YVFFAGMGHIGWDFGRMLAGPAGSPAQHAHLFDPNIKSEIPWTALIILALSTNTWYYATDQFINQRCLGAKNEWHAKMGVLLAGGIQIIMPLATCFPGMIYAVMRADQGLKPLADFNLAYPSVVKAVVPLGLRGLVVAAVIGAIMSTISGLVNSTSTMVSLDILRRWKGRNWSEMKVVRSGQWVGVIALLIGAGMAGLVMNWDSMFRYCQDIWAPMAAPAVVVFLSGALWKRAKTRGAIACLWMSILTVPVTFGVKYISEFTNLLPGEKALTAAQLQHHAAYLSTWMHTALPIVVGATIVGCLALMKVKKSGVIAVALGLPALLTTLVMHTTSAMQANHSTVPSNLQNAMVWGGGVYLIAIVFMLALSLIDSFAIGSLVSVGISALVVYMTLTSAPLVAFAVLVTVLGSIFYYCTTARKPTENMWDRSMLGLPKGEKQAWYSNLWIWWLAMGAIFVYLYIRFW
ncbi:MAG: hypothetical protein Q7N50_15800, partial [Armatimonadota bacterium]|nr:hypothetical protein [Armatimonadota bacterium]